MVSRFKSTVNLQDTKQIWFILSLCALISTASGAFLAVTADHSYIQMMRLAVGRPVSIVGTVLTVILPFIVSAFLIIHSKPWLVYLICGIYLFLFSAAGCAITISFGTAGWLMQSLVQFSDLFLIPVLIFLSILRLTEKCGKRATVFAVTFAVVIGMIDYCLISPFLANLIDSYETIGRYAIHVGLDRCL